MAGHATSGPGSRARWRVAVDRSACRGSGMCIGLAPEHFGADDSGKALPRAELVSADEAVLDAAESCPLEAITVTDEATGQRLAPPD